MTVDPDGHVWLEPWRPHSARGRPFHAIVVNLRSGAIDSVRVDAFPSAFRIDGSIVSLVSDPELGRTTVLLQNRRGGP